MKIISNNYKEQLLLNDDDFKVNEVVPRLDEKRFLRYKMLKGVLPLLKILWFYSIVLFLYALVSSFEHPFEWLSINIYTVWFPLLSLVIILLFFYGSIHGRYLDKVIKSNTILQGRLEIQPDDVKDEISYLEFCEQVESLLEKSEFIMNIKNIYYIVDSENNYLPQYNKYLYVYHLEHIEQNEIEWNYFRFDESQIDYILSFADSLYNKKKFLNDIKLIHSFMKVSYRSKDENVMFEDKYFNDFDKMSQFIKDWESDGYGASWSFVSSKEYEEYVSSQSEEFNIFNNYV